MNTRAIVNEFAKMLHLRVGLIAAVLVLAVFGLTLVVTVSDPDLDPRSARAWTVILAAMSSGVPLVSPLLLAVLASRQVDIENSAQGWLLQATAGITPGMLCRAKLLALGLVVAATVLAQSLLVLVVGRLLIGISAPAPLGQGAVFGVSVLGVDLVVLALQVLVSARVENQLVGIAVGVLGTLLAVFSAGLPTICARVTPWGHYTLASAAGYEGERLVSYTPSLPGIAGLVVVAAVFFWVLTARFDRQEA